MNPPVPGEPAVSGDEAGAEEEGTSNGTPPSESASGGKKRQILIGLAEKTSMVFLILFVCYLSWTLPSQYGFFSAAMETGNGTFTTNTSAQEETMNFTALEGEISSTTNIPNVTDLTFNTNIMLPTHRKQFKKRRKKQRNRKRNRGYKNRSISSENGDRTTLRDDSSVHKACSDCKIRKRKGRNKYSWTSKYDKISLSTLRKILERVAYDTLSGARSGDGTISSLDDSDVPSPVTSDFMGRHRGRHKNNQVSFNGDESKRYDQPYWFNLAGYVDSDSDRQDRRDENLFPWSEWSACTVSCGTGQQERMRRCGTACKEVESMACSMTPCEGATTDDGAGSLTEFYRWEQDGFIPPIQPPEQDFLDPDVDACAKWVKCNTVTAHEFIEKSEMPACPCLYPLQLVKTRQVFDTNLNKNFHWIDVSGSDVLAYKPEAAFCIRSQLQPGTMTLAVQQCCYDDTLHLLTRGKSAGTPNLVSPDISRELHYKVDLLPWVVCKGDWTRYNQVLNPNNQIQCPENPDDEIIAHQVELVKNY